MPKKRKRIIIASVCAVAVLGGVILFFLLSDSSTDISAGDKVIIHVSAPEFEDMYGYEFKIRYNRDELAYSGELTSDISEIYTIFSNTFDDYELVGATMIGDSSGVSSGRNTQVCQIAFEALADCVITEESISIDSVGIVSSELDYEENIAGWSWKVSVGA